MAIIHGSPGEGQRTQLAFALVNEQRAHTLPVLINGVLHMQICSREPVLFPDYAGPMPSGATEVGRRARGYHGELKTGQVLNALPDDWRVIYDLPLVLTGGLYDCDALIVGPKGNWIVDSKFQRSERPLNTQFLAKIVAVLGVPVTGAMYAHWGEYRPNGYPWTEPPELQKALIHADGDRLAEAIDRLITTAEVADLSAVLRPSGVVPSNLGATVPVSIVPCAH